MDVTAKCPTEILVFEVFGQRFGLRSEAVVEVVRAVTLIALPEAPAIVEGVIDLRGSLVPVLDIRSRFRLPAKRVVHTDHFIVAQAGGRRVVLRADRAIGLVTVPGGGVEDVRAAVGGAYVSGAARTEEGVVLIHDLPTFLSAAEAEAVDRAVRSAEGDRAP